MSTTFVRAAARLLVVPVATSAFLATPAPSTHAETRVAAVSSLSGEVTAPTLTETRREIRAQRIAQRKRFANRVIAKARSRAGSPYVYGATGPHAFDCSGLTQWVYRKVGKRLPRTSDAQAGAVRRVRKPRRGDLVFFHNGGNVYHVGIYAGHHKIWHASRPGHPVAKESIWASSVFYGRVR
ncbi:MAG TPA: NlpC/P60 family protein [Nocardioides sp.]|nr:NlpC/P60 family protein [Nocardioides sp.]